MIFAYLCGSIISAVLVCRCLRFEDPRIKGSKNPGVSNVARNFGKQAAILVLIADTFKGFFPVYLATWFNLSYTQLTWIGFAAIIGHMYPIFFHFKGGKGIATTFGVLLILFPYLACALCLLWVMTITITRYVSIASLLSVFALPFAIYFIHSQALLPILGLSCLIIWKHRGNISRLSMGNESRFSLKRK